MKAYFQGNENKGGIYVITNIKNGRFYIGKTNNFLLRYKSHSCLLKCKKHFNPFLQRDFNKHGTEVYDFSIVEVVDDFLKLYEIEKQWIQEFFNNKKCHNCDDGSYERCFGNSQKSPVSKIVKFSFISPDNEVFEGENLTKFCKEKKLNFKLMYNLLRGYTKSSYGWRTLENKDYVNIGFKTYDVKIISKNNEIFGPISNVEDFSRKHNLIAVNLSSLIKGRLKSHRGWRLLDNKDYIFDSEQNLKKARNKIKREKIFFNIKSPEDIIYENIVDIPMFCKEHNLNYSSFRKLVMKKRNSLFGWELISSRKEI